jgi:hypothetical protein
MMMMIRMIDMEHAYSHIHYIVIGGMYLVAVRLLEQIAFVVVGVVVDDGHSSMKLL